MKPDLLYLTPFPGLRQAGQHCADYLARHVREDGSFEYEIYARTGRTTAKYNILRHAGAIYAFSRWMNLQNCIEKGEITERKVAGGKVADIMELPVAFLLGHTKPLEEAGNTYCIVEGDEVKLGGTALALLALVERYKLYPRKQDRKWMVRLAEFIVWMQDPGGKFYSKFFYREKTFSDFESTYYPGEAILSLLRLYQMDPDPRWLQAAVSGSEYLLKHPVLDLTGARGHNHWFVIALSELMAVVPREDFYTEFQLIVDSTIQIFRQEMTAPASSASVATFGETMVAALLQPHRERPDELFTLTKDILRYCLGLQVIGQPDFIDHAKGGIMESHTNDRIRIDFVQHTLQVISGFLLAQDG